MKHILACHITRTWSRSELVNYYKLNYVFKKIDWNLYQRIWGAYRYKIPVSCISTATSVFNNLRFQSGKTIKYTTGGPSSSCEMIILRNNGHGGIIRVCMGIFTTALRNKKNTSNSQKKYLTLLPQSPFERVVHFEVFNVHKKSPWAACEYTGWLDGSIKSVVTGLLFLINSTYALLCKRQNEDHLKREILLVQNWRSLSRKRKMWHRRTNA